MCGHGTSSSAALVLLFCSGKRRIKPRNDAINEFLESSNLIGGDGALEDGLDHDSEDEDWAGNNAKVISKIEENETGSSSESSDDSDTSSDEEKEENEDVGDDDVQDSKQTSDSRSAVAGPADNEDFLASSEPVCHICLGLDVDQDMLRCAGCGVEIHESCCGIAGFEDPDEGVWWCDPCKAGVQTPVCMACPIEGGLLKQTEVDGRWIHLLCGMYIEQCCWGDDQSLSPVMIGKVPANAWHGKVRVCDVSWVHAICFST